MSTTWGYARCSTNESKQDVKRQVRDLAAMGVNERYVFMEYEHGTRVDRPELIKLFAAVQEGDTICVTELSRLTRSMKQLIDILEKVHERKLCIIMGAFTFDCRRGDADPMAKAMAQMMGVFAEMEREMTVQRVRSGMANARAKGVHIGREKTTAADVPAVFRRNYERYRNGEVSFIDCCRMSQVGKTAGYKYRKLLDEERRG